MRTPPVAVSETLKSSFSQKSDLNKALFGLFLINKDFFKKSEISEVLSSKSLKCCKKIWRKNWTDKGYKFSISGHVQKT